MRYPATFALLFALPVFAMGQATEPEVRFGVRQNTAVYPQDTAKNTMSSLLRVLDRQRYDYLVAFFMEPGYVAEQLRITYPKFEAAAREQVRGENLAQKGFSPAAIRERITELATQANFEYLVRRVRTKLDSDPDTLKEMRRIARNGDIQDEGETATVRFKEIKDRAIFLHKIGGIYYIENRYSDEKPGE
jgi:hypothetical protein